jgi:hypothetical protein
MVLFDDMLKGGLPGVLVGVGVVLVAPLLRHLFYAES